MEPAYRLSDNLAIGFRIESIRSADFNREFFSVC